MAAAVAVVVDGQCEQLMGGPGRRARYECGEYGEGEERMGGVL